MEIVWLCVLGALLVGYFALEGFDLGVGMLLPVLGRTQERRDLMVAAIAPFVLANEVWLVAAAGVLFGAFPLLEGKVLFGLYPLVVPMLLAWVLRDAGLWFRRRTTCRGFWDAVIALGSVVLSFAWGMALFAIATGFSESVLHPLGLMLGAFVTVALAGHGRAFLRGRVPGFSSPVGMAVSGAVAVLPVLAVLVGAAPELLDHSGRTLGVLSLLVLPVVPFMVAAQLWVWRTFSEPVEASFF